MKRIRQRFTRFLTGLLVVFTIKFPLFAYSQDYDQIAVIEDTFSTILPASGLCSNLMYPNGLCVPQAGQAFYATHPDNYDILIFITNKALPASEKTGYPVQADVKGIGYDTTPWNYAHLGSQGRLLQAVTLGSIQSLPDSPEGIFSQIPISGLEIIGHEIGHHWLAYANVNHNDGRGDLDILRGYRDSGPITHWSCWFNSDSVMYGGMLTDNGDGSFTDINGPRKFSYFDQYLMGLRSSQEVGPLWYVQANGLHGCADWPQARGVAHDIYGYRKDFGIEDVIRAVGERNPSSSPCHYKVAFVFVHSPGTPPSSADLAKFETYRLALENWWIWATDSRGSLDTRLDGCGTGSDQCPGDASAQCGASDGDDDPFCTDGETLCSGQDLLTCNESEQRWDWVVTCTQQGEICVNGACVAVDGDAELAESDGDDDLLDAEISSDADSDPVSVDGDTISTDGDSSATDGDERSGENDYPILDGDIDAYNSGSGVTTDEGSGDGCTGVGSPAVCLLLLLTFAAMVNRQ